VADPCAAEGEHRGEQMPAGLQRMQTTVSVLHHAGHAAWKGWLWPERGARAVCKISRNSLGKLRGVGGSSWQSAEPGKRGVRNFPASLSLVLPKQKFVNKIAVELLSQNVAAPLPCPGDEPPSFLRPASFHPSPHEVVSVQLQTAWLHPDFKV